MSLPRDIKLSESKDINSSKHATKPKNSGSDRITSQSSAYRLGEMSSGAIGVFRAHRIPQLVAQGKSETEIPRLIGQEWAQLPPSERRKYVQQARLAQIAIQNPPAKIPDSGAKAPHRRSHARKPESRPNPPAEPSTQPKERKTRRSVKLPLVDSPPPTQVPHPPDISVPPPSDRYYLGSFVHVGYIPMQPPAYPWAFGYPQPY
jgi:hypothetical protein